MSRSSLGELFFKILADTSDLSSANKDVDKFSKKTQDSAKAINKAAASADDLSDAERKAARQAEKLYSNAQDVVKAHKQAAKEAKTLAEAEKIAADEAGNISNSFAGIGKYLPALIAGFSALGAINSVKQLAADAKALNNSAKALGIGVETLSEYQYAFNRVNVSGEKTVDMFKDISDRVGEFANSGGGELTDILKRTNLEINELIGLSPDQQLLKIYDALENIDGITQSEIISYLEQLVSDATLLQPLLANGAEELRKFRTEGALLGQTLDQFEVDRLVEVDKEMRILAATWDGFTNDLIVDFAPALTSVLGGFSLLYKGLATADDEVNKLNKSNSTNTVSFETLEVSVANTKREMHEYINKNIEGRAEIKKGINARIAEAKSYLYLQSAALKAAVAKDIAGRESFAFFSNEEDEARKYAASVKILTGNIKEGITKLETLRTLRDNLGDSNKLPDITPKKTFAQGQAVKKAEAEAAAKKKLTDKLEADRETRAAALLANQLKRDKASATRAAKSAENQIKREKAVAERMADTKRKADETALKSVESYALTKRDKENKAYQEQLKNLQQAQNANVASLLPYHQLKERLEQQHVDNLKAINDEEQNRDQAQSDFDNVVGGLGGFEAEQENARYLADQEFLAVARELKLESIASYDEIERVMAQEHSDRLLEIKRGELEQQSSLLKYARLAGVKFNSKADAEQFQQQGNALEGMIGQAASYSKKAFELQKAMKIAQAMIDMPAAVMSSYTFGTKIGGPIVGAVFGGVAAGFQLSQIAQIQSANFSGRQFGGSTNANTGYQINEDGPEVWSQGGKDYFLGGAEKGKITPLEKAKPSSANASGPLRINITVDGQQQQEVLTSRDVESIAFDVVTRKAGEVVAGDFQNPNSKASKGLKENYKVTANL